MAERADLDAVQRNIERYSGLNTEEATALVAELRVAREVAEASRGFLMALDDPEPLRHWTETRHHELAEALAAYDRHAQPSTPDRSETPP